MESCILHLPMPQDGWDLEDAKNAILHHAAKNNFGFPRVTVYHTKEHTTISIVIRKASGDSAYQIIHETTPETFDTSTPALTRVIGVYDPLIRKVRVYLSDPEDLIALARVLGSHDHVDLPYIIVAQDPVRLGVYIMREKGKLVYTHKCYERTESLSDDSFNLIVIDFNTGESILVGTDPMCDSMSCF